MICAQEVIARLRLLRSHKIGRITFLNFLKLFKTAQNAIENLPDYLKKIGKAGKYNIVSKNYIENFLNECQKSNVKLIFFDDLLYPKNFLSCTDFSPLLFCKGNVDLLNKNILAVVGSRVASLGGVSFTKKIVRELKEIVIISGLAKGIDSVAHEASLNHGTIAVLGCGVDYIYPVENEGLYNKILQNNGLIISEIGLNDEPRGAFFSYRNRIISGVSNGVLVVEAALDSGSLITAKYANEQGKNVFAVPGHPYDLKSVGTNYLLKNGAILVRNSDDILDEFWQYSTKENQLDLFDQKISEHNFEEIKDFLLQFLSNTPILINDIVNHCDYSIQEITYVLAELELLDLILIERNFVSLIQ